MRWRPEERDVADDPYGSSLVGPRWLGLPILALSILVRAHAGSWVAAGVAAAFVVGAVADRRSHRRTKAIVSSAFLQRVASGVVDVPALLVCRTLPAPWVTQLRDAPHGDDRYGWPLLRVRVRVDGDALHIGRPPGSWTWDVTVPLGEIATVDVPDAPVRAVFRRSNRLASVPLALLLRDGQRIELFLPLTSDAANRLARELAARVSASPPGGGGVTFHADVPPTASLRSSAWIVTAASLPAVAGIVLGLVTGRRDQLPWAGIITSVPLAMWASVLAQERPPGMGRRLAPLGLLSAAGYVVDALRLDQWGSAFIAVGCLCVAAFLARARSNR